MGKKAIHLPTSAEKAPVQKKTADSLINALIEKRKLQQGALIKIISSMDKEAANHVHHAATDTIRKKNTRTPKK